MPEAYEFVHFNDVAAPESIAYLIQYDSIHGTWGPTVKLEGSEVVITDGDRVVRVAITSTPKPSEVRACRCRCQVRVEDASRCRGAPASAQACVSSSLRRAQIDYAAHGVEVVLECTGVHLNRKALAPYFASGVKKVVVSAPVKDADPVLNIVVGCNEVRRGGARLGSVDTSAYKRVASLHEVSQPLIRAQLTHTAC